MTMKDKNRIEIEAATFRRLLKHLDEHKEVQNIDLIGLSQTGLEYDIYG